MLVAAVCSKGIALTTCVRPQLRHVLVSSTNAKHACKRSAELQGMLGTWRSCHLLAMFLLWG
jgi:hypothetical protein